jgi:hypothetical protein
LLAAVLFLIFVLRLSRQPGGKLNLGSSEFDMGRASAFASDVASNGPLIFPALHGSDITLYVQHLGKIDNEGWLAFSAHDPGQPASCYVRWRPAPRDFIDRCDQAVYPADGQGLDQYATQVDPSGDVIIDLHQPIGTTPPTATTSTTSTTPTTPTTSLPAGATGTSGA